MRLISVAAKLQPSVKVHVGKRQGHLKGGFMGSLFGVKEEHDVYWEVDYTVAKRTKFNVEVAYVGAGPGGAYMTGDSGHLFSFFMSGWGFPSLETNKLVGKKLPCRVLVSCEAKALGCDESKGQEFQFSAKWTEAIYGHYDVNELNQAGYCKIINKEKLALKACKVTAESECKNKIN